jgi:epoxyqueuosine reductase
MSSVVYSINEISNKIKAEAFHLGFSLCGITSADQPAEYDRYIHWLENGYQAGMHYLNSTSHREKRLNPSLLMPGVRSIISLAWTYPIRAIEPDEEKEAQVAGYAVGSDYHVSLFNMLKILAEYIRTELNTPAEMQGFTDSSAILEKEIASRAGLGWIGKNSCLISPKVGSSFLLAELFTTLPLTPDQPFRQDRCGTCHRCLDACPTGCILPERTLDVRKCLSYLTIENKGNIPEKMRALIGNWIFGCDICQMVCPWNRKFAAKKTKDQLINWTSDQVVER